MLQQNFNIRQWNVPNDFLNIEVGTTYIALSAFGNDKTADKDFEFYTFDINDHFDVVLLQIKERSLILKQDYKYTKIIWENSYAQYIPTSFYDDSVHEFIYDFIETGLEPQKQLLCKNEACTIVFLVDKSKWDKLHTLFPNAEDSHKYFEIISHLPAYPNDDRLQLLLIFYSDHFIITAVKNNRLQFINTINFSSGIDVVYCCLNSARQLNTSISIVVTLCGLIDGDSDIYKEIYQYIQNIDVDTFDDNHFLQNDSDEYPAHFFVPFFKYA